jgi:AraC family transcriptional regulator, transcriptional activator of pobA
MHAIPTHRLGHTDHRPGVERIGHAEGEVRNGVHRHAFHELFFFLRGSGRHMIDLEMHPIEAPCIHVVAPGQVHCLERSPDMEGLVVMFGSEMELEQGHEARAALFSSLDRPRAYPITAEQAVSAAALIGIMEQELSTDALPAVLNAHLAGLLIKCLHWSRRADGEGRQVDVHDAVRRFSDLLERHFLNERQVAWYADQLAITPGHLNALVKQRLGLPVSTVIQDRLLLEARRLLLHSGMSVKEVSHALHIEDPGYFNRLFKKATGSTPLEFRTRSRKQFPG